MRSNLHDYIFDVFACAEATEGLLPHELFDSWDVLEEGRFRMFEVWAYLPVLSGQSFAREACDNEDRVRVCFDSFLNKLFNPFGVQICDVIMEDFANLIFKESGFANVHFSAACARTIVRPRIAFAATCVVLSPAKSSITAMRIPRFVS